MWKHVDTSTTCTGTGLNKGRQQCVKKNIWFNFSAMQQKDMARRCVSQFMCLQAWIAGSKYFYVNRESCTSCSTLWVLETMKYVLASNKLKTHEPVPPTWLTLSDLSLLPVHETPHLHQNSTLRFFPTQNKCLNTALEYHHSYNYCKRRSQGQYTVDKDSRQNVILKKHVFVHLHCHT